MRMSSAERAVAGEHFSALRRREMTSPKREIVMNAVHRNRGHKHPPEAPFSLG
jgi:hypothetical protein